MFKKLVILSFILPIILIAQEAQIELLRSDIRAKKIAIITETMNFTSEEASVFWPVYRDFNTEHEKIGDERVKLIKNYLKFYENMTDGTARELWKKSIEIEQSQLNLRKEYYKKFEKILSAKLATKLMHVNHQINTLIRIQIDAQLPLIK